MAYSTKSVIVKILKQYSSCCQRQQQQQCI